MVNARPAEEGKPDAPGRGWAARLAALRPGSPAAAGGSHGREILGGAATALAIRLIGAAAGYLFTLVVARLYGARGMGLYELSLTALTLVGLVCGLGFGHASLRLVPQHLAEGHPGQVRRTHGLMLRLALPASAVGALLLWAVAPWAARAVFRDPAMALNLRLAALFLPAFVLVRIHVETIRALKDLRLSEYLRNPNTLLVAAALLLAFRAGRPSAAAPIAAHGAGLAATLLLARLYLRGRLRRLPDGGDGGWSAGRLLGVSTSMIFAESMTLYLGRIQTAMIGALATAADVGVYEVAFKLAGATSLLLTAINTILAPKLSELYWSGRRDALQRSLHYGARLIFWASVPVLLAIAAAPRFWLALFGPEFVAGRRVLLLVAAGQFVNSATGSVGVLLNMTGHQHVLRNIILVALALNVAINAWGIPRWGIDAAGAAGLVTLLVVNLSAAVYARRALGLRTYYLPGLPGPRSV
jgi:O-antigen/teichoic acid export membrane protein